MINKLLKIKYLDVFVIFFILVVLFNFLVNYINSDYNVHLLSIIQINLGKLSYSPHFLFYYLVNLFSGFSVNKKVLIDTTILVLSIATTFKYILTKKVINLYTETIEWELKKGSLSLVAFFMLFAFVIPDFYSFFTLKYMYMGRVPPVIWHNSTLILVFPFSILLFIHHLKMDKCNNIKILSQDNLILLLLVALNIVTKPSFVFVYLPVAGAHLLIKNRFKNMKQLFLDLLPLMACFSLLLIQYLMIYFTQVGSLSNSESGIAVGKPFEVISAYIPYWYVPIGLLFSYIYPLLTYFFYKDIMKFRPFVITLGYALVGFVISYFIVETGPRHLDANFMWQGIICSYLLLLTTTMYLFPKLFTKEKYSKKMLVLQTVFILQFLSGILYITKMFYTKSFF